MCRQFTTDGTWRRKKSTRESRRSSERHDGTRATFVGRKHVQHASGTRHNRQQRETLRQGEAGVTRRERGLALTSARCAARASQRASEVRPRTVGSPVGVLGPDELARRFMRAHGGARRDLLVGETSTSVPLPARARKRRGSTHRCGLARRGNHVSPCTLDCRAASA